MANISLSTQHAALMERVANSWTRLTGTRITDKVHNTNMLRIAATLVNGQTNYQFQLKSINSTTQLPFENKLDEQDVFVAAAFRLSVVKVSSNAFGSVPFTYPDATIFSAANEATQLNGLWIGSNLSLVTNNNTVRFSGRLPELSLHSPNRFLTAATQTPERVGSDMKGFVSFDPMHILNGKLNNVVNLNWGPYATSAIATTGNTVLLDIFGVQIVSGADTLSASMNASEAISC